MPTEEYHRAFPPDSPPQGPTVTADCPLHTADSSWQIAAGIAASPEGT
jgi:hypothetical protein